MHYRVSRKYGIKIEISTRKTNKQKGQNNIKYIIIIIIIKNNKKHVTWPGEPQYYYPFFDQPSRKKDKKPFNLEK